jgi:SAM-dependent methyltransferase
MVHHSSCPVCYSSDIRQSLKCTDHFRSGEVFNLYTCTVCGFTFTQDHPSDDEAGKYYESAEYISHSDTSEGITNKIYRVVRGIMLRKKRELIKSATVLKTGTLLDIGTGTGHFAHEMKINGWEVSGIEINDKARQASNERFGLSIISPADISLLKPGSFDCITLWHVLEHFNDIYMYIREINRLLKPGGTVVIALPNKNSYDADHFREYWAAWDVPRHVWHFNPDTLGFLFESRGFKMYDIVPLRLDVFYISILSEKYRGNKLAFLTGIMKGFLFALKALFNKKKTSSLIYILRK